MVVRHHSLAVTQTNFLVWKKLFGHTNHYQLSNLLHLIIISGLSNLNCQEQPVTLQKLEKKNALVFREFV